MKRISISGIAASRSQRSTSPNRGKALVTAAIMAIAIVSQPTLALAAHGGGSHAGSGFHGGGFHASGFHGGFHQGAGHDWHAGGRGWSHGGLGWGYAPYTYGAGSCGYPTSYYTPAWQCGVAW